MKKILPILLVFCYVISFAQSDKYKSGKVIVKFKTDTEQLNYWIENDRNTSFSNFDKLLGEHQITPFISNSLINLMKKRFTTNTFYRSNQNHYKNLQRIAVIDYSSEINPVVASKKLSKLDFIEYSEPIPTKYLVAVPNDSLIHHQYYLNQIKIFDAWDSEINDSSIVIGIVDTGIDYEHDDLQDKIWVNPDEIGEDKNGNEKSSNGIDDDDNGFIDDWRGWDFVSSSAPEGDNDPYPGNNHGTHVAGISAAMTNNTTGIAGISKGAKLLPVKIGSDNPFSSSVTRSYEGILYAGLMGADVINCSWGSESRSEAEMEILESVTQMGSLVVAAAGNDGREAVFFPASHKDALSVAAVSWDDEKAGFSNYHYSVDVSAPGVDIFSTIPGNNYESLDGTSMAAPVVSGIAGIVKAVYPDYSPLQVKEHIKASSDNTDSVNINFVGKLGRGRVNAYNALQDKDYHSVIIKDYHFDEVIQDEIFEKNEEVFLSFELLNVLSAIEDFSVEISFNTQYPPSIEVTKQDFGFFNTGQILTIDSGFNFILPDKVPADYLLQIELSFYNGNNYLNSEFLNLTMNPSYRTLKENNVTITINSVGNMAFNDYPGNFQGEGFRYKQSSNLLYEGALMLATSEGKISDVARGADQMRQNDAFNVMDVISLENPGKTAKQEAVSKFRSFENDINLSAEIINTNYQFDELGMEDNLIVVYDIINNSNFDYDSLYAALYFDWDIGPEVTNNIAKFDNTEGFGYVKDLKYDDLPWIGVTMLSAYNMNYYAIDNDGNSIDQVGVWDGFYREEKIVTMSSGIYRKESNITDVSMVVGAGPINLKQNDTARVAFNIFVGDNLTELTENNRNGRYTAAKYNISNGIYNPLPSKDSIVVVYPNPISYGNITVEFALANGSYVDIDIFNSIGQKVFSPISNKFLVAGVHKENFEMPTVADGRYYIMIKTTYSKMIYPFEFFK